MHPEMYLVIHRQQERELERRLDRALVLRERALPVAPPRPSLRDAWRSATATPAAFLSGARTRLVPADGWGAAPACCPA
ncbi:hypothetical protein [Cellulomonas sp.]|uniref:hypothetical protein n=1 Tax=Cellulomonas sp. TaxID=40001 RepID=UPI001B1211C0|nr:hypothetical protein [Cellulomonas sp.]MBO9554910.1 hypothetical protein [Cellulomonas sp.]